MNTTVSPIVCPGHSRPIVDVRFCHTKGDSLDVLISACHDKTSQLRWADNGAWIGTYKGHDGAVWSAAIDESGQRVLTGSADFSVKLWDATTGTDLETFPHKHVVKAVDFSPKSDQFLSAGLEKKAHVFDLNTKTCISTFEHSCPVSKAVWLSETTFATGGYDGILRIWDKRDANKTSKELNFDHPAKKGIVDIEFVENQNSLVISLGRKVVLTDLRSEKPKLAFDVPFDVEAASLSPNGRKIVAGGSDLWVHLYDISSFDDAKEISVHKGHHGPIFCVRWETNGTCIASGSEDGTIRLWPISQS